MPWANPEVGGMEEAWEKRALEIRNKARAASTELRRTLEPPRKIKAMKVAKRVVIFMRCFTVCPISCFAT